MLCQLGLKICALLRWLMSILTKLLAWLDMLHDRLYCSHSAVYVRPPQCPQKGVFS